MPIQKLGCIVSADAQVGARVRQVEGRALLRIERRRRDAVEPPFERLDAQHRARGTDGRGSRSSRRIRARADLFRHQLADRIDRLGPESDLMQRQTPHILENDPGPVRITVMADMILPGQCRYAFSHTSSPRSDRTYAAI